MDNILPFLFAKYKIIGFNWDVVTMPNLKPSSKTISLRLPEGLLNSIKIEANKRGVPFQSLIKSWLADNIKQHQS